MSENDDTLVDTVLAVLDECVDKSFGTKAWIPGNGEGVRKRTMREVAEKIAATLRQRCSLCEHPVHVLYCEEPDGYDHINGDHACGCPGSVEQIVFDTLYTAAAEMETATDFKGRPDFRAGPEECAEWLRDYADKSVDKDKGDLM